MRNYSDPSEDDEKGEDMMYVCVCIIGTYIIFIEVLYYECIYIIVEICQTRTDVTRTDVTD